MSSKRKKHKKKAGEATVPLMEQEPRLITNPTSSRPIVLRPLGEARIALFPSHNTCTYFSTQQPPMSIIQMHKRVIDGMAESYYGTSIRLARLIPTSQDADRWPSLFKGAKEVWLLYGMKKEKSCQV